jgi:diguanylate cyclase (GGDEF)-like protein/PAS domain S-box-containing protein
LTHSLSLLFLVAAASAVGLAVAGWRRRQEAFGFVAMAMIGIGVAQWSMTDAVAVLLREPGPTMAVLGSGFVGVCVVVAGWHCLSFTVIDRTWRPVRGTLAWLAVEPVLCLTAIATNPWHGLFFVRAEPTGFDGAYVPIFGPLFWVHSLYSYTLLISALVRVGRGWIRASTARRGSVYAIGTALPPLALNVVGLAFNGRLIDLTALGFSITVPMMYLAATRLSLPATAPVAHQRVFQKIGDAVAVVDRSGLILDVNPAAERLLRRLGADPRTRLTGTHVAQVLPLTPRLEALLRLAEGPDTEHTLDDAAGSGVDLNVRISTLYDRANRCIGWAMVGRDITDLNRHRRELERANARLREQLDTIELLRADLAEQAVRDHLTGLHNRRYLMRALDVAVNRATAEGTELAVALVDLDHFKQVNDRYGHATGDAVLLHVAGVLARATRDHDVVARHGGEEFVLVLAGSSAQDAVARLDTVRRRLHGSAARVDGTAIAVTFSAGVASFTGHEHPSELLQAADRALYAAKAGGRNRVEVAAPTPA